MSFKGINLCFGKNSVIQWTTNDVRTELRSCYARDSICNHLLMLSNAWNLSQCHTSQIHSKWRVGWIITTGIAEPLKRGHKYSSSSYRYWNHQCFEWSANFLPFVTSARLGMSTLSVLAMTVAFTLKRQKQVTLIFIYLSVIQFYVGGTSVWGACFVTVEFDFPFTG